MTHERDLPRANELALRLPVCLSIFGCGAALGAALGIALAPAPGRDVRRAIAAAGHDGRVRAAALIARGRRAAAARGNRARAAVHETGEHLRETGEHLRAASAAGVAAARAAFAAETDTPGR